MKVCRSQITALIELTDQISGVITVDAAREVWGYASYDQARKRLRMLFHRGLLQRAPEGGRKGYTPVVIPPRTMSGTAWRVWRLMQDGRERTKHEVARTLFVSEDLARRVLKELEDGDEPLVVSVDFLRVSNGHDLAVYQETGAALRSVGVSDAA